MKEISSILNLKLNFEKITKRSEEFRSSLNLALEGSKTKPRIGKKIEKYTRYIKSK